MPTQDQCHHGNGYFSKTVGLRGAMTCLMLYQWFVILPGEKSVSAGAKPNSLS